ASGAIWDEWYASFSNGKWGWLAEAQGRFYLTFAVKLKEGQSPPPWNQIQAGRTFKLNEDRPFTVNERGVATTIAVEGELPKRLSVGAAHQYADFSGEKSAFATLDYGPPDLQLFVGRQVTLDDLQIRPTVEAEEKRTKIIAAKTVACPQCGGSLDLVAPDRTERVVCPFCRAELDANQGELKYLRTLAESNLKPLIPLGRAGKLRGEDYLVIGFMQRSVVIEGRTYYWTEYLLFHEKLGFRWLVNSDGHWSFVEPLSPGEVKLQGRTATWNGRTYQQMQRSTARVTYVLGEFYWKVSVGERVLCCDFINPPDMLSTEETLSPGDGTLGLEEMSDGARYNAARAAAMNAAQANALPPGFTPLGGPAPPGGALPPVVVPPVPTAPGGKSVGAAYGGAASGDAGFEGAAFDGAAANGMSANGMAGVNSAGPPPTADGPHAREITVSHGVYVTREEIQQAFGVKLASRSWGVAPNQPNPVGLPIFLWSGAFFLLLCIQCFIMTMGRPEGTVDPTWFLLASIGLLAPAAIALIYRIGFEKSRWENQYFEGE
ncbi:MAG TPA: DUF4178 domain-containing protein, partial [Pirellulaceae bacterium]|nr:DUF4178 domain-containing protein [Pirellulaceae bacterium]